MLGKFRRLLPSAATESSAPMTRRLASAVLLLELARSDIQVTPAEEQRLRELLHKDIGVPDHELEALLAQARDHVRHAVSLHEYVDALNRDLAPAEKSALLRLLWQLAYVDGRLDPHEEHLVRRLADLLHVPHSEYIRTKLEVGEGGTTDA